MSARIMALDYGTKRIGLALSDPLKIFAKPYMVIPNSGLPDLLDTVAELISRNEVELLVVGMPYAIEGGDTPKTIETREFVADLKQKLGIKVITWDERYSSQEAEAELKRMGKSWQEARSLVDAMAAAMILKSYMENVVHA